MLIVTGVAVAALYLYVGKLVIRRVAEEWWFYSQLPASPLVLAVECSAWPLMIPMHGLEYLTAPVKPLTRKHFEA